MQFTFWKLPQRRSSGLAIMLVIASLFAGSASVVAFGALDIAASPVQNDWPASAGNLAY
jgi:hypothetical protein